MRTPDYYHAARISLIYIIVAGSWIFISDNLLGLMISDRNLLTNASALKGLVFVLVTAALLYLERVGSERANRRIQDALEIAEHRYRDMFEDAPIGIFQATPDGRYTGANTVFARMLGYDDPRELAGKLIDTTQESSAGLYDNLARSADGRLQFERQYRRKDGKLIDANLNIRLVKDDANRRPYLEGFIEDITERKAAEQQIEQMADIVRWSQDAIYSVSPDSRFLSWNPAASAIYGYSAEEIEGKSAAILFAPDRMDERVRLRALVFSGQSVSEYETVHVRKDGSRLNVSLTYSPIKDTAGNVTGISAIVRDITERTQIMQRLEEQQKALREYAHRLIESQEDERKRLSRELHDDTLQDMVALAQRAELSRTALDRDHSVAVSRLDELQALAKEMIVKLRRISNDLRPLILEDLGIAAAVQFVSDELEEQMPGYSVRCEVCGEEQRLDADVEITAFRIVQQALNNVRLHAPNATSVEVKLCFENSGIVAVIQDDGPGFTVVDTEELVRQGHLGLAGMQERAGLLGGQVQVISSPQAGTTVRMRLPYVAAPAG
ncbi:MAG: PAS domain S-box protein [Chloroflexi bacterium]|nr:PAS domain S-box protein [Chloroflexota bacterium]